MRDGENCFIVYIYIGRYYIYYYAGTTHLGTQRLVLRRVRNKYLGTFIYVYRVIRLSVYTRYSEKR